MQLQALELPQAVSGPRRASTPPPSLPLPTTTMTTATTPTSTTTCARTATTNTPHFVPLSRTRPTVVSYCECFATGIYCCDGCNCVSCYNNFPNEKTRRDAIETTVCNHPPPPTTRRDLAPPPPHAAATAAIVAADGERRAVFRVSPRARHVLPPKPTRRPSWQLERNTNAFRPKINQGGGNGQRYQHPTLPTPSNISTPTLPAPGTLSTLFSTRIVSLETPSRTQPRAVATAPHHT